MEGEAFVLVAVNGAMRVSEVDMADAVLGAVADVAEVIEDPPGDDPFGIHGLRQHGVDVRLDEDIVGAVVKSAAAVVAETLPTAFQSGRRHLAVGDVSVQEDGVAQPEIEFLPVEIPDVAGESRQLADQFGMVIVVSEQEMELAFGGMVGQFMQPVECGLDGVAGGGECRPFEVEDIATEDAVFGFPRLVPNRLQVFFST